MGDFSYPLTALNLLAGFGIDSMLLAGLVVTVIGGAKRSLIRGRGF